jgi:GT2 family glycosyltransferase
MTKNNCIVSVIVPVYNRAKEVHRCLEALLNQTFSGKNIEILVVDDYSTDKLQQVIEKYPRVKYVMNELEFSLPAARNMGLRKAKGDIIIFLDDDALIEKYYIEKIVEVFQEYDNVGGVTGKLKNVEIQDLKKGIFGKIMKIYSRIFGLSGFFINQDGVGEVLSTGFTTSNFEKIDEMTEVKWLSGCNMCYSRKAIEDVGLFDSNYSGHSYHEDSDFSYRIYKKGYKLYATPYALVEHLVSSVSRKKLSRIKYYQLIHNNRFFLKNVYTGSKIQYIRHLIAHVSLFLPVFLYSLYDKDPGLLLNYFKAEKVILKRLIKGLNSTLS